MSEQLHRLLLRLYPPELQGEYGRETLQLVRDRWRDERGIALRLRLCMDLAVDLLITALRDRRSTKPLIPAGSARASVPSFTVLDVDGPRPEALVAGVLLSIVMMATFARMMDLRRDALVTTLEALVSRRPALFQSSLPSSADAVDSAARHKVIAAVVANLAHYVNPTTGRQLADAVLTHERNGDYDAVTAGSVLADRLTQNIRETSRAIGIPAGAFVAEVVYSRRPLPPQPPPTGTPMQRTPAALEAYRAAMVQQNCLFEKVETLPPNIGYVKLNGFPDASVCQTTTSAAMASVNNVGALIVDLRDNAGGYGNTVMQIAAYLFDHPEYIYDPRENTSMSDWTASPVSGSRLTGIPVYVLSSSQTFSAAEHFTYNLKMLKRATIVGETTRGGQHSGAFQRIDEHFGVAVQQVAPINPFPVKGWEIIGVEPDVKVPSREALDVARKLAESRR